MITLFEQKGVFMGELVHDAEGETAQKQDEVHSACVVWSFLLRPIFALFPLQHLNRTFSASLSRIAIKIVADKRGLKCT